MFNIVSRLGREVWGLVNVKSISSAKREHLYFLCRKETPLMSGCMRMDSARGSRHKINSKGDTGYPCLVPLLWGKDGDKKDANCTWEVGQEYKAWRADTNEPANPKRVSVANIYGHPSLSNAF